MAEPVEAGCLDSLFREARTHSAWLPRAVSDGQLREMYELARMAPTSMNSSPMRVVFVRSPAAKERLRPALMPGNVDKTMSAPVTAIVAYDARFHEFLPKLFPHMPDAGKHFAAPGREALAEATAFRNGSLQGAYLILAARALGLDVGPMSGFDNAKVDAEFFPDGRWKSNFLLNLGYGDAGKLHPRGPRLSFDEACRIV